MDRTINRQGMLFHLLIFVITKRDWRHAAMQHTLEDILIQYFHGISGELLQRLVARNAEGSKMHIVFIHGHRATAHSFNFLSSKLQGYPQIFIEYDSANGFDANHRDMVQRLDGIDDIFFVAHSLGGLHALHLAEELQSRVLGAVTISTPYGGSEAAEVLLYMMPFNKVFRDIHPRSTPVTQSKKFALCCPWTNIVSLKGHTPLMVAANDGVVTLASMRHRDDIRLVEVESNHFEVLQHEKTVATIRHAIREIEHDRIRRVGS